MSEKTIIGSSLICKRCRSLILNVIDEDFFKDKKHKIIFNFLKNNQFENDEIDSLIVHIKTKISLQEIEKIKEDILTEENLIIVLKKEIEKREKEKKLKQIEEELRNESN
ncbi:MAG: DnaB-like helicase N-terminal domain-containing protein [Candidatus Pacearchaeota archaeon]